MDAYKQAQREAFVEKQRHEFRNHAILYAIVNAGLAGWNVLMMPGDLWFYYVLIFWGIGLATHFFLGVHGAEEEAVKEQALIEARVKG